jgi:hypothetical protein
MDEVSLKSCFYKQIQLHFLMRSKPSTVAAEKRKWQAFRIAVAKHSIYPDPFTLAKNDLLVVYTFQYKI